MSDARRRWTGQREDAWTPDSRTDKWLAPQYFHRTLHLCLFDYDHAHHVQNGYAYASPLISPVDARRLTRAQFEYLNTSQEPTEMVQPCNCLSDSPTYSNTAPDLALANEYLTQQYQQQDMGTSDEPTPTPTTRRMYGYHAGFPSSFSPPPVRRQRRLRRRPPPLHDPRTGTALLHLCKPLHAPRLSLDPYS